MGKKRIKLLDQITVDETRTADGADAVKVAVQEKRGVARDRAFRDVLVNDAGGAEAALWPGADGVVDLDRDDALGTCVRADFEARQR